MNKQISYKLFLTILIIPIFIFASYHVIVFTFYTSKIFDRNDNLYVGDIGRMSYQVNSLYPRKLEYTLNKKHLNHQLYNDEMFDILTNGDSFSNAATGGLNPYYQDYLADKYDKKVLNILKFKNSDHDLFEIIIALYNNGWLKEHQLEMIIIESAERSVYARFAKEFDFSLNETYDEKIVSKAKQKDSHIPKLLTINTANYKLPYYSLMYHFKDRAFKHVVQVELMKNLFTTEGYENKLLFHYSDILNIDNDYEKVKLINDNFNKLALLLKSINIKLVFMPAVDKYDLYSDYIINNKYPKNKFFDMIRPLKKEYFFIDTKKILSSLLKKGVKDVYYSDDTHWSYKASNAISDNKVFSKNLTLNKDEN